MRETKVNMNKNGALISYESSTSLSYSLSRWYEEKTLKIEYAWNGSLATGTLSYKLFKIFITMAVRNTVII